MPNLPTDKLISCFYDSSNDCVKVMDTNGTLLSFNPNGLKVMEIDNVQDVIGKDWLTFWRGDIQKDAKLAIKKAATGKMSSFKGFAPTYKGTLKYWEVSVSPLFNDYGDVQWLLVTSHDSSRLKELEDLVEKQKAEIKSLKLQQRT